MKKLIELSLGRPRAVTVAMLAIVVVGVLALTRLPVDILPVYNQPAVQTLTFYSGMPAELISNTITNPLERWTGLASGMRRQESRSILGASIIRNYFHGNVDPNGALTQVNSLALADVPNLPPGTLPPSVLPYDPTATVPVCLVAVDSQTQGESVLYDVGRYEVRNMIMSSPGANAPVVYGGKVRAILALLDPVKLQARKLSPTDVLEGLKNYNPFIPTGDAKFGITDYAIDSNAMVALIEHMNEIPIRVESGGTIFLGDVATAEDSHFIQTCIVRVNGRREVYIPVFKQTGASTLTVVDHLKQALPTMPPRLTRPGIDLKMVMDQAVYVRQSIQSLAIEGLLGAVLCSLVILFFLGEWKMTAIAALMIPLSILAALTGLELLGQTINVMTLAGLALAIGPLVDTAIVCLENIHRHMTEGQGPHDAASTGTGEVIMPVLVATCSTLLVLAPLGMMAGTGQFLFKPLALTVGLTMISAFVLAMSFVPSRAGQWLKPHQPHQENPGRVRRFFDWIGRRIDAGIGWYTRQLDKALRHRWWTVLGAAGLLGLIILLLGPQLRRDFFPEVDAGAFEMYVRADTGTRIEVTEDRVAEVEKFIKELIGADLALVLSEIGVWADWSAAYTPNTGPMDAVIRIQLTPNRQNTSQYYAELLRTRMAQNRRFASLEVAFNTGGTIRSALNEGKVTPINLTLEGKDFRKSHEIAERIRQKLKEIDGVVDARILQRLDYPEYFLEIDRAKARRLGLTQDEIMKNVVAATNSSIQFYKRNFWIDPVSKNQYYVGVQYHEKDIQSLETILNVSITSPLQKEPIPLYNLARITARTIPAVVTHSDLMPTIDLSMNVHGRDLGHVADDIIAVLNQFGAPAGKSKWQPYDNPDSPERIVLPGTTMTLSGEYGHMEDTFANFGLGLALAVVFIYFMMVVLLDSYLVPLVVLGAVPVGLVGVLPLLYLTGTALNVQSLLGIIFMVGIVVSNTVLLTDFAENMRKSEGLAPEEAIRRAARLRARPVVMTAVAALFALVPMALALERGSEANAPLGRAVIGGLLAGLCTTLFVVPAFYTLAVRQTAESH